MLINEVCKRCGLTKKAIEYYEEQGLTRPQIMENGYRVFSEDDVIQLNKSQFYAGLEYQYRTLKRFWQRMTIYPFKLYATRKNWKFRIYKRNNNYSTCLRETRIGRMPGRN
ncbi:MerR family transcriptional regulator [Faecalibacterium prausnitzii]|nr:MerR family transcriptional regulator [Faecalibacterium prausnitzii]